MTCDLSYMQTWITTLSTIVLTVVTAVYVWLTWKMLSAQSDPCVIVTVRHDSDRSTILQLVAKNIGRGIAYDVRFEFSHPVPAHAFGIAGLEEKEVKYMTEGPFVTGIPALGPDECRIIDWGQYGGLKDALGQSRIRVLCRFRNGTREMSPTNCPLEVDSFLGTTAHESTGAKIAKNLDKISKGIDKLSSIRTRG